jgi:putative membrane protein
VRTVTTTPYGLVRAAARRHPERAAPGPAESAVRPSGPVGRCQDGAVGFLIRLVITAIALWITTLIVPGVEVTGRNGAENALTLLAVAIIFGVVNAVLKPVIKVFGCVFYLLTLGLFALVVNALLFLLTDAIAGALDLPFHVDGFWAAFWGAIVMAVVSWLISVVVPDRRERS